MAKLYDCPNCGELSRSDEWENATLRYCNRELRRKFIPFDSERHKHKKKATAYKCPNCNEIVDRMKVKESELDDDEVIK